MQSDLEVLHFLNITKGQELDDGNMRKQYMVSCGVQQVAFLSHIFVEVPVEGAVHDRHTLNIRCVFTTSVVVEVELHTATAPVRGVQIVPGNFAKFNEYVYLLPGCYIRI